MRAIRGPNPHTNAQEMLQEFDAFSDLRHFEDMMLMEVYHEAVLISRVHSGFVYLENPTKCMYRRFGNPWWMHALSL
jgi:hypothetical protein